MASTTVTTALAVDTLPFTSVTVKVTLLLPTFVQSNEVLLNTIEAIPHASDEPLFTAAAVVLAAPVASKLIVTFCATAFGALASTTVTV